MKHGTAHREDGPKHISECMRSMFDLRENRKKKKESLNAYDRLLLAVDKAKLNISGIRPSPEDSLEIIRIIIELENDHTPILSFKPALCFMRIKELLLQKISNAPRSTCNIKWHTVTMEIKKHPKLLEEHYYRRLLNYTALLE